MKARLVIRFVTAPPLLALTGLLAIPLVAASGGGPRPPSPVDDIPKRALEAYQDADGGALGSAGSCSPALAGSNHATARPTAPPSTPRQVKLALESSGRHSTAATA